MSAPGNEDYRRLLNSSTVRLACRIMARRVPRSSSLVIGNNQLGKRVVAAQDDMAAVLSLLVEPGFLECPHTLAAGEAWQIAHTATSIVSKCSSGTGSPSSCKAAA